MPPLNALAATGVRSGAARAGGTDRRRLDSKADRLACLGDRFDQLQRDVSLGATSHRETERQIAEAEAIAGELRSIFLSPSPRDNAPRWQQGGKAFW